MVNKWLGIGIERSLQGAVDFPFRLGNVGEQVFLDGFALTWSGSAQNTASTIASHLRQVLCTLYNPSLQFGQPVMGAKLRNAGQWENFDVHNGLFAVNLKQKGVAPTHLFTPVKYDPPILIPDGELRIHVALQTEGSSAQQECLNIEVQGVVFFHTP